MARRITPGEAAELRTLVSGHAWIVRRTISGASASDQEAVTAMAGPAARAVLIGVGNEFRRDDGVGLRLVDRLRGRVPAGVRTVISDGDPAELIEAWAHTRLTVVVDAVLAEPGVPGRLHRLVLDHHQPIPGRAVSSHGLGVGAAVGLAHALNRLPRLLIVHAVEAADVSPGTGLSVAVAAALPELAAAVLADLTRGGR